MQFFSNSPLSSSTWINVADLVHLKEKYQESMLISKLFHFSLSPINHSCTPLPTTCILANYLFAFKTISPSKWELFKVHLASPRMLHSIPPPHSPHWPTYAASFSLSIKYFKANATKERKNILSTEYLSNRKLQQDLLCRKLPWHQRSQPGGSPNILV